MSPRDRMTWGAKSAAGEVVLPIEVAAKRAAEARKRLSSAHPATPDEGITHPAGYQDPEADAYETGDTSSWAEDVHPGPYRTSPAPADPMDDGGYRHPAAQPGAPARNASLTKAAAEIKATKCVRIASTLLGQAIATAAEAGDKVASDMIEQQALAFMDLDDTHLAATIRRIEAAYEDEDTLLRKMLASEDEEESEEEGEDEPAAKEASSRRADDARFAEILSTVQSLKAEISALRSPKRAEVEEDDEEAMLASLLAEDSTDSSDEEAMLAEMLAEDSTPVSESDAEAEAMLAEMLQGGYDDVVDGFDTLDGMSLDDGFGDDITVVDDLADFDAGVDLSTEGLEDPMGLYDEVNLFDAGDEDTLSSLFASSKVAEDASEGEEEEKTDKSAAGRTAAHKAKTAAAAKPNIRPQPKKASTGAQAIGTVRLASGEQDELARLWETAPDVTGIFNR